MSFLAAPLLWGLAAAGVPVIIHLTARAKPVIHRFPAMRFLQRSQRNSSRTLKLKHLLILLLRIAALVLIALALARPQWTSSYVLPLWTVCGACLATASVFAVMKREFGAGLLGVLALSALYFSYPRDDGDAHAQLRGDYVLVVDRSMSMSYAEPGGGTRLESARKQALQFLDRLAPESRVALIYATETAERVQGRLTFRADSLREKLKSLSGTGRGLDMNTALVAASEIIERDATSQNAGGTIVFFTDLQSNAISALLNKNASAAGQTAHHAGLVIVDCGSNAARNGGILGASLPGSIFPPDTPVNLTGKIRPVDNKRPCLVELYLDEKRVAQKVFEPAEQDELDAAFTFQSGPAGAHMGRLHLADMDALLLDQNFVFSYESGHPPAALILESPAEPGGKGSAFFLRAALQAGDSEHSLNQSGLTFAIKTAAEAGELNAAALSKYKVLILADCGALSDPSWSAVREWCADGGGLFVWMGPHTDLAGVRKQGFQEFAKYHGLLPGKIGALVSTPLQEKKPLPVTLAQTDHPLLAHFNSAVVSQFRETHVSQFIKIVPDIRDVDAETILTLGEGSPFLIEKSYGRGRVLLCAAGPGLEFSDLPKRGEAYVTLVLDSIRVLSGRENDSAARLGFPLTLTLPAMPDEQHIQWLKPDAFDPVILPVDAAISEREKPGSRAPATLIVPALETPGIHRFSWTRDKVRIEKLVAVNNEPSESVLTKSPEEAVARACAAWQTQVVKQFGDAAAFGGSSDGSHLQFREFTVLVLIALAGILMFESFLSNRLYKDENVPVT